VSLGGGIESIIFSNESILGVSEVLYCSREGVLSSRDILFNVGDSVFKVGNEGISVIINRVIEGADTTGEVISRRLVNGDCGGSRFIEVCLKFSEGLDNIIDGGLIGRSLDHLHSLNDGLNEKLVSSF
jgi:hypothetical protein